MIKSSGATERRGPVVVPPCDKFTSAGDSTRRTDGLRDADVPTEDSRCWHGLLLRALSSSSFISPQSACLSASVARPNSDTVRTPTQTRKGKRRKRREREKINALVKSSSWTAARKRHFSLFFLWLFICHYFASS